MSSSIRNHWPEYLMEAALLGLFMMSACAFGVLFEHPDSPVRQAIAAPILRRALMGIAMGATAIGLVYSPWGKQSGAHLNPSLTLTFLRLKKIAPRDAISYMLAQTAGAVLGVLAISLVLGSVVAHPSVNYVATVPGAYGTVWAFLAETAISFIMMSMVLKVSNTQRLAHLTGVFAGTLVAIYITLEAPISGMSMNPARTTGSAVSAQLFTSWWIYLTAPVLGMQLAAELYLRRNGAAAIFCAKLCHSSSKRCIFCAYQGR